MSTPKEAPTPPSNEDAHLEAAYEQNFEPPGETEAYSDIDIQPYWFGDWEDF